MQVRGRVGQAAGAAGGAQARRVHHEDGGRWRGARVRQRGQRGRPQFAVPRRVCEEDGLRGAGLVVVRAAVARGVRRCARREVGFDRQGRLRGVRLRGWAGVELRRLRGALERSVLAVVRTLTARDVLPAPLGPRMRKLGRRDGLAVR